MHTTSVTYLSDGYRPSRSFSARTRSRETVISVCFSSFHQGACDTSKLPASKTAGPYNPASYRREPRKDVRLVITVTIRPTVASFGRLSFYK
jgi:hypothetical protein